MTKGQCFVLALNLFYPVIVIPMWQGIIIDILYLCLILALVISFRENLTYE